MMAPRGEGELFKDAGGDSEVSRTVEAYWIRLDVDYDDVWWLRKEPRFVKDAFPNLIRYVRLMSPRKGEIRFKDASRLAYACRYSEDEEWAFIRMLGCAQMTRREDPVPAVVIDLARQLLRVVRWAEFQGAEAAKKRRQRQQVGARGDSASRSADSRTRPISPGLREDVPDEPAKSRTNPISPDMPVARDMGTWEHELIEKPSLRSGKERSVTDWQGPWEEFCNVYPNRLGSLDRSKALEKFKRLLAGGQDPEEILRGLRAYRSYCDRELKTGTAFVCQMTKFLNSKYWLEDFAVAAPATPCGPSGRSQPTSAQVTDDALAFIERRGISGQVTAAR